VDIWVTKYFNYNSVAMRKNVLFASVLFAICLSFISANASDPVGDVWAEWAEDAKNIKIDTLNETPSVETAERIFEIKNLNNDNIYPTYILEHKRKNLFITPRGLFVENDADSIQLWTDGHIDYDDVYLYEDDENYYFFFTESAWGVDGSTSWLQKISKDPLNSIYATNIWGFNLGKPIIHGNFAYVSAIGFVGKIDITNGKYAWKHDSLYNREKAAFTSFQKVIVREETVEFWSENIIKEELSTIIVDNESGEIIKIIIP